MAAWSEHLKVAWKAAQTAVAWVASWDGNLVVLMVGHLVVQ